MADFVQLLSDPNITYLLLTVGALGILAECFHPGTIVLGLSGAICIILGFVGLSQLPFSWNGLAFLGLAFGLLGFELATGVSGVLGLVALAAFLVGSFTLYSSPANALPVVLNPWLVGLMALTMTAFFFYVLYAVRHSRLAPVASGIEALRRSQAQTVTRLNPRGKVRIEGEVWTAELADPSGPGIEAGLPVAVVDLEGVVLKVRSLAETVGEEQWTQTGWQG